MARMHRRQAILGLIASVATPAVLAGCVANGDEENLLRPPAAGAEDAFYTPHELAVVSWLADAIIPRTDTPGALDAGVPATLDALMAVWASPATQKAHRRAIAQVGERLREIAGANLEGIATEQRVAAVATLDAEAYVGGQAPAGMSILSKGPGFSSSEQPVATRYRALKALIAEAFYASEAGAMQELHYEPVPGRWIPDASLAEVGRTWAE
jgi:gluconate 2-dehydrogenase gamma chain